MLSSTPLALQDIQDEACDWPARRDGNNKPDLIERLFSGLFGKDSLSAEEPGGMKRLSQEVYEQQGPATTTEVCSSPSVRDKAEVRTIRPLLAKTSLEKPSTEVHCLF